jgi:hypothetical protein
MFFAAVLRELSGLMAWACLLGGLGILKMIDEFRADSPSCLSELHISKFPTKGHGYLFCVRVWFCWLEIARAQAPYTSKRLES